MATQPQPATHLEFGPFEVNVPAGEIRKSGVRVRLPPQPFEILLFLLAHPGDVVTREQLRERIWSDGTFVDFERGLNSAMTKLRRALCDSAETPRYIETVSGRGYRFIGLLAQAPLADCSGFAISVDSPQRRSVGLWWWLVSAAACLVSFAAGWRFYHPQATLPPWKLTRLTSDSGLSSSPALSPDGKLVAYSSDRNREGEWDLFVQQVAGGQPIRLTSDGAGNTTPDFSPDSSRIVFRSNRDGGGIYEIPAFGGEARLLAREGRDPKFSPDGLQVAYWWGEVNIAPAVPGNGTIWVVPRAGGQPRRVGPGFTSARQPIWSPDGKHLLFTGYTSKAAYDGSSLDWWLVAANGGSAARTGAYDALARAGLKERDSTGNLSSTIPIRNVPRPACWLATNNTIVFSTEIGDTSNLWAAGISRAGIVNGEFKRLTAGAGNEVWPSCASNGALAFTNLETRTQVWSLPFDLDRGRSTGPLERITEGPSRREYPYLSGDGRYVAFASAQSARLNIWLRELANGKESRAANSPFVQRFPILSASGSRIAFSSYENDKRSVYVTTRGGSPEILCEGCLRATDWSRDEKTILVFGGSPYRIDLLDVASHQRTPIFEHPAYNLLYGRFSPDNRWVSFTARTQPNRAWIAIAPVDGPRPVPEGAWIKISEEGPEDRATWSPDGKTLYFASDRDGHTCLWGQQIDDKSHRPVGQAFAAQHFHERPTFQKFGWSAGGGRIAMVLLERTGNIWMMSR